jgi:hypothetical protein
MFDPITTVAVFVPVLSLLCAWAFWKWPQPATPRDKFTFCGLMAASITTVAVGAFLLVGSARGRAGFLGPPAEPWLITNWLAFALWIVAVLASIFGRGRSRIPLAAWALLVFMADYVVVVIFSD